MRSIILLPTYNNAHTLADVITDILQAQCAPLMVVDDGSTDETLQILSRFSGIIVLHHPQNLAKGQHFAMVSAMLANVATRTSLRWTAMVSILQATFRSFSKP